MKHLIIIYILSVFGTELLSQIQYDAHFVMGYWSDGGINDPILQFRSDSVQVSYQKLAFGFTAEESNISSKHGNLLFYFNGCDLANGQHEIIENGTGFNPGQIATRNCPGNNGYTSGYQSSLILPLDDDDKKFIILHHTKDYIFDKDTFIFYGLPRFSIVDMTANNGKGKVTIKNQIYLPDTTIGGGNLTAIRHANNKDWWIMVLDIEGSNNYYRVLLSDGKLIPQGNQEIGKPWIRIGGGQASFSSDGKKYFRYSGYDGLSLMDFDRNTGLFSNYRHMKTNQKALTTGASFSPNGRFIYLGNGPSLVQIDTEDDIMVPDTIAIWDGTTSSWGQPAWFGYMQSGPDCRIYMTTGYCIPFLHVIMEPDKKGIDCDVRQHMIELKVPVCNLPYFPNYRLGTNYPHCDPDIKVLTSVVDINYSHHDDKSFHIFPNPTTDKVMISGAEMHSIQLFTTDGKEVFNIKTKVSTEQEIDLSALPPALYMVRITYGKEYRTMTLKCIKIK